MNKADLKLDWCSHAAAKWAVEHWHYSRKMPMGKLVKIGAWEYGRFIGVIVFGTGASPQYAKWAGVRSGEICELVRVALREHENYVTRIISIAMRLLRRKCPGLHLVLSYADTGQGHDGAIYRGGNWAYTGVATIKPVLRLRNGKRQHNRAYQGVRKQQLPAGAKWIQGTAKHRYLYPLTNHGKLIVVGKMQQFRAGSIDSDATANHADQGGATPTSALLTP